MEAKEAIEKLKQVDRKIEELDKVLEDSEYEGLSDMLPKMTKN